MAEYIKREAVINRIKEYALDVYGIDLDDAKQFGGGSRSENYCEGLYEATELIDDIPAADVAPVVRCKDCKHYRNHPNGLCYLHTEPKENARGHSGNAVCVEPDDFCSYGERKNGDRGIYCAGGVEGGQH